jgi:hypothetical protein
MSAATDQLAELQAEFAGMWHIWRSQRDGDPVSWCATRLTRSAGVDPTVICTTAESLRAALTAQRKLAAAGPRGKQVITI